MPPMAGVCLLLAAWAHIAAGSFSLFGSSSAITPPQKKEKPRIPGCDDREGSKVHVTKVSKASPHIALSPCPHP